MQRAYLIRYGLARAVARFEAGPDLGPMSRGESVVVRTHRGTELGEILAEATPTFEAEGEEAPILRAASLGDLERAERAEADRPAHFDTCQAVFDGGDWPLELIDAEPLLDEGRTVLHYLGPHRLDVSGLVAAFRARCGLDVVLEPAGLDVEAPEVEPESEPETHSCGSCGSNGGGCGSGGCSTGGCAVKAIVARSRAIARS